MITVEIFEDLQCPDCARLQHLLDDHLLAALGETVTFVRRDFPLVKHPGARGLAEEAQFLRHTEGTEAEWAWRRLCLFSIGRVQAPVEGRDPAGVDADLLDAHSRGVAKTPTVFVGNHVLIEKFTADELIRAIQDSE
jgi:protein-disulfide isomerase